MDCHKTTPFVALSKELLPNTPWFFRGIGFLNHQWKTTMVESVLASRKYDAVMQLWEAVTPDRNTVEQILTIVCNEIGWKTPHFIPEDELLVAMQLSWWSGWSDCMERERCLLKIEETLKKHPPPDMFGNLANMTLGEFVRSFE